MQHPTPQTQMVCPPFRPKLCLVAWTLIMIWSLRPISRRKASTRKSNRSMLSKRTVVRDVLSARRAASVYLADVEYDLFGLCL